MTLFLIVNLINIIYFVQRSREIYTIDSVLWRTPTNVLPGASPVAIGDFSPII